MNKILVIGASGQIGTELTLALRQRFGGEAVLAADLKRGSGPVERNRTLFTTGYYG